MTATTIFPLAQWLTSTNQNSTSANDNALRVEACFGPALSIVTAAPGSPADHDQHIVGTGFGGHAAGNIIIYLGGTWHEFETFDGMLKSVAGVLFVRRSVDSPMVGEWDAAPVWGTPPAIQSSPGKAGQIAFDTGAFYVCVGEGNWGQVTLSTF